PQLRAGRGGSVLRAGAAGRPYGRPAAGAAGRRREPDDRSAAPLRRSRQMVGRDDAARSVARGASLRPDDGGPGGKHGLRSAAVSALGRNLGAPVLADALSGVRRGAHIGPEVIAGFDSFLRDKRSAAALKPDFVLRFGAPPVSKALNQFLETHSTADQIVVGE